LLAVRECSFNILKVIPLICSICMLTNCPVVVTVTHWRSSAYKLLSVTVMTLCRQPSTLQPVITNRKVNSCTAVLSYCREFEFNYFGIFTSRGMWRCVAGPVLPGLSVDRIAFIFRPWRWRQYDRSKHGEAHNQRHSLTRRYENPQFGIGVNPSSLRVGSGWQNTCLQLGIWMYNICGHLSTWHWVFVAK
jgi:hypothetical protein